MKRSAAVLFVTALFSTSVWAATPVEREMNDFSGVSQPKSDRAPEAAANESAPKGYNKAIEEHKEHMMEAGEARHEKHGKKPHTKKHHHKSDIPANK